jgi:hypothetical protein
VCEEGAGWRRQRLCFESREKVMDLEEPEAEMELLEELDAELIVWKALRVMVEMIAHNREMIGVVEKLNDVGVVTMRDFVNWRLERAALAVA